MFYEDKKLIYKAFLEKNISVLSVSVDKKVEWKPVLDVTRHEVSLKDQYKVITSKGRECVATEDHSLFLDKGSYITEIKTGQLNKGDPLVIVEGNNSLYDPIESIEKVESEKYMYDLTVQDNENFVLDSGVLAHNSFRPPASEKFIQGQTQVFGFVWEDEELYEHLLMAIDDFNSRPPTTGIDLNNITSGSEKRWRTTILLRAAAFACFAISMNWILDEFSVDGNERLIVQDEDGNEYSLSMMELFDLMYGDKLKAITDQTKKEIIEAMKEVENGTSIS